MKSDPDVKPKISKKSSNGGSKPKKDLSKFYCEEHNIQFSCRQMHYSHKRRYHPETIKPKGVRKTVYKVIKEENSEDHRFEPKHCFLCSMDFPDLQLFKKHMKTTHKTGQVSH